MNEDKRKKKTISDGIKENLSHAYSAIEDWMRPKKSHPIILQILFFILKLPVLLLLLLLSPVLLVVLLLVFLLAL
ncbi:hypothetical protein A9970_11360 [Sphingobacterium sp. UME9]|nr:hypothetical protein [Sphingobacterium sp. UME9]